jgi:integrase
MAGERLQRGEPIRKRKTKDGRIRYVIRVDAGVDDFINRKQVSSTWDTIKEARDEVARIRTELRSGTYVGKRETTVKEYLDEWLRGLHSQKPKTVMGYRDSLRVVMDAHGDKPLQALAKRDLDALVTSMLTTGGRKGTGRSPRTVTLMLTILSSALQAAKKEQRIAVNVAALVAKPQRDSREQVGSAWTAEQARAFLRQVANCRYVAAWRLSLYGLRRGEVLGLSWDGIELEAGTIKVATTRVVAGREVITSSTKNRKVRTLKVGPEVLADLRQLKALQTRERLAAGQAYASSGLVVVNELGIPMRPERYGDLFQIHANAAGLPRIRLHDLRHTTASLLHSLGQPPAACAKYLGHTTEVYLRTYAHLYAEDEDATAKGLSALYAQAQ